MSGAQDPELASSAHVVNVDDLRALTGAATPQFALQLRDRVAELIDDLDADDPARTEGERQIARLERLARSGQAGGQIQAGEQALPSLTLPEAAVQRPDQG